MRRNDFDLNRARLISVTRCFIVRHILLLLCYITANFAAVVRHLWLLPIAACQGFPCLSNRWTQKYTFLAVLQRRRKQQQQQQGGRMQPFFLALTDGKPPRKSQFGRQDYWNDLYETQSNFSWYAGWEDLAPFVREFIHPEDKVLIPGVGNDAMLLVNMFDDGFTRLTAMDYAPEGISRCCDMLGPSRIRRNDGDDDTEGVGGVDLRIADARNLSDDVFESQSFDAVIEKGTLDAIFLSGGQNKTLSKYNLNLAITELGRCVKVGGIWISIAAVVDDLIQVSFDSRPDWDCLVEKGDLFVTQDGYTSNNIDGSLLVWRKRPPSQ